jgi:hypothetical protein
LEKNKPGQAMSLSGFFVACVSVRVESRRWRDGGLQSAAAGRRLLIQIYSVISSRQDTRRVVPAPLPMATSEVVVVPSDNRVSATTVLLGRRTTVGRVARALPSLRAETPVVELDTAPPVR